MHYHSGRPGKGQNGGNEIPGLSTAKASGFTNGVRRFAATGKEVVEVRKEGNGGKRGNNIKPVNKVGEVSSPGGVKGSWEARRGGIAHRPMGGGFVLGKEG